MDPWRLAVSTKRAVPQVRGGNPDLHLFLEAVPDRPPTKLIWVRDLWPASNGIRVDRRRLLHRRHAKEMCVDGRPPGPRGRIGDSQRARPLNPAGGTTAAPRPLDYRDAGNRGQRDRARSASKPSGSCRRRARERFRIARGQMRVGSAARKRFPGRTSRPTCALDPGQGGVLRAALRSSVP